MSILNIKQIGRKVEISLQSENVPFFRFDPELNLDQLSNDVQGRTLRVASPWSMDFAPPPN